MVIINGWNDYYCLSYLSYELFAFRSITFLRAVVRLHESSSWFLYTWHRTLWSRKLQVCVRACVDEDRNNRNRIKIYSMEMSAFGFLFVSLVIIIVMVVRDRCPGRLVVTTYAYVFDNFAIVPGIVPLVLSTITRIRDNCSQHRRGSIA